MFFSEVISLSKVVITEIDMKQMFSGISSIDLYTRSALSVVRETKRLTANKKREKINHSNAMIAYNNRAKRERSVLN